MTCNPVLNVKVYEPLDDARIANSAAVESQCSHITEMMTDKTE